MYLSKVIKADNHLYVYDALNNKFATINSENDLLDDNSYVEFLHDNNFRDIKKPCEFEIKYPFSEDELKGMFSNKVKSVTLALTEQCNLRCKYCGYMPKYLDHDYHLKEMSREIAFMAIDFLMKNSQESDVCNIGFYGGEPLLRLDLIKECIAYVKERYPFRQPTYNITTNATLLNDEVVAFLIDNDIQITISLDGPEKEQNKYRVDGSGKASYDKAYQNIQELCRSYPKYFKESVNYNVVLYNGASEKLFESLDNLWKSDVTLVDLFETEYFKQVRDKRDDEERKDEPFDAKVYDFAYRNMLMNMKKYYNAFNTSEISNIILPGGFCIPGVRKNFITTDGKIIVCEKVDEKEELFEIGDVYMGIDMKKIKRLVDETVKCLGKCKHCWAARFCNICFMDVLKPGNEYCEQSRKNVENELGYYLDQICEDRELVNYISNISLI
ncbi:radical SAM protein [Lachnospiraceae bacterium WCA-9-b2]|uniref:Radical SAM protein n=1 Tax=Sporofaciens musculi TaxID=2681861 RepID=A0A7X3MD10_9FIRM|nr:lachnocin radical SAM maturase [Sporofaciens musculi]MXP74075.1 radical SAM protein [Sporofaciens musculi]